MSLAFHWRKHCRRHMRTFDETRYTQNSNSKVQKSQCIVWLLLNSTKLHNFYFRRNISRERNKCKWAENSIEMFEYENMRFAFVAWYQVSSNRWLCTFTFHKRWACVCVFAENLASPVTSLLIYHLTEKTVAPPNECNTDQRHFVWNRNKTLCKERASGPYLRLLLFGINKCGSVQSETILKTWRWNMFILLIDTFERPYATTGKEFSMHCTHSMRRKLTIGCILCILDVCRILHTDTNAFMHTRKQCVRLITVIFLGNI